MSKPLYIVGVDGSEWAGRAVAKAVELAKETGANVLLASIIPWSGFQPLTLEEINHRPVEKKAEETKTRQTILDPLIQRHQETGVEISIYLTWGHPVEMLHKIAKDQKAQMIFLGRRGRSRIADLLLGSVANSLAHLAGVPVVLVP